MTTMDTIIIIVRVVLDLGLACLAFYALLILSWPLAILALACYLIVVYLSEQVIRDNGLDE